MATGPRAGSVWTPLATVLAAALLLCGGIAVVLWLRAPGYGPTLAPTPGGGAPASGTEPQRGSSPAPSIVINRPDPTGESAAGANDVFKTIGEAPEMSPASADRLEAYAARTADTEQLILARSALGVAADRLRHATMAPEVRLRLERLVVSSLSHAHWRMRLTAMACVQEAGMLDRPDVAERIRAMRTDPEEKVLLRAKATRLPGEPVPDVVGAPKGSG